jgi:hypothetical protein
MSLFGRREKRKIEEQARRIEQLFEQRNEARTLAGIHQGNLVRMAQARSGQHDENVQLRKEVDSLGRILTREVTEAAEDVAAAEATATRYRLAWTSARFRAAAYGEGILRLTKDRDSYAGWLRDEQKSTANLRALAGAVKDSEATS